MKNTYLTADLDFWCHQVDIAWLRRVLDSVPERDRAAAVYHESILPHTRRYAEVCSRLVNLDCHSDLGGGMEFMHEDGDIDFRRLELHAGSWGDYVSFDRKREFVWAYLNLVSGRFVPGLICEPFMNDGLAFLDEVDVADPGVLVGMNALISDDRYRFPDGKVVERHRDFFLLAGGAGERRQRTPERQFALAPVATRNGLAPPPRIGAPVILEFTIKNTQKLPEEPINMGLGRNSGGSSKSAEIPADLFLRGDWMRVYGVNEDFHKLLHTEQLDIMSKWTAETAMHVLTQDNNMDWFAS